VRSGPAEVDDLMQTFFHTGKTDDLGGWLMSEYFRP
jgi:hypothetical protein